MAIDPVTLPQNVIAGLLELSKVLEQRGVSYALIGGIAAGYRSQPRFTEDIDLILQVPQVALPGLLDDLHAHGFEFDTLNTIRDWVQNSTAVMRYKGVRVDWLKPVLPCYQHVIDTANKEDWLGAPINVASTESLIFTKLMAFRTQDIVDIEKLLAGNTGQLDLELIRREWATVADADDPRMVKFNAMLENFYYPP